MAGLRTQFLHGSHDNSIRTGQGARAHLGEQHTLPVWPVDGFGKDATYWPNNHLLSAR